MLRNMARKKERSNWKTGLDIIEESYQSLVKTSCDFFDLYVKKHQFFVELDKDTQIKVKSLCCGMLAGFRWLQFCSKVNGWDSIYEKRKTKSKNG